MDSSIKSGGIVQLLQYIIYHSITYNSFQSQQLNMNQTLNSQNKSHISPPQASYGIATVKIQGKTNCIIMTSPCINSIVETKLIMFTDLPLSWYTFE